MKEVCAGWPSLHSVIYKSLSLVFKIDMNLSELTDAGNIQTSGNPVLSNMFFSFDTKFVTFWYALSSFLNI